MMYPNVPKGTSSGTTGPNENSAPTSKSNVPTVASGHSGSDEERQKIADILGVPLSQVHRLDWAPTATQNASGGESPLSEQTQDFNKVCGLPLIFVVEGSHSRTAFFNRTEAERYLAERKQPERFAIVEYVKSAGQQIELRRESDGRWLAEVPTVPGCMAYGRTQSEAVIKVGKLLEEIEAEKNS